MQALTTHGAAMVEPLSDRAEVAAERKYDRTPQININPDGVDAKLSNAATKIFSYISGAGFFLTPFSAIRNGGFALIFGAVLGREAVNLETKELDNNAKREKIGIIALSTLGLIGGACAIPTLITTSLVGLIGLSVFKGMSAYNEGNIEDALQAATKGVFSASFLSLNVTGSLILFSLGVIATIALNNLSNKIDEKNHTQVPTP